MKNKFNFVFMKYEEEPLIRLWLNDSISLWVGDNSDFVKEIYIDEIIYKIYNELLQIDDISILDYHYIAEWLQHYNLIDFSIECRNIPYKQWLREKKLKKVI